MKLTLHTALGCFRVLRRRTVDLGQPGLAVWTDTGARAALDVGARVARVAHADEVADLEAKKELEAGIVELQHGRPVREVLAHLRRADRLITRSAELAHDISEEAKL